MFAVFRAGNNQYKVSKDDILKIEKIDGEPGVEIIFDQVLVAGSEKADCKVGAPFIKGAVVKAEVLSQTRDKKILVFKKKRRKNYCRKNGHRQEITQIKIKEILAN